jgi:hypothetical protein
MNINLNSLLTLWRKFWFEPTDTLTVCVFRICYGILVLQICLIHLGDHFKDWYGPRAIVDINTVIAHFWYNEPHFDLLLLFPQSEATFQIFFYCLVAAASALALGFCSRYAAALVWLALVSLHHHDPYNINGGDAFLRAVGLFLAFSPCGDYLSIDSLIMNRGKGLPVKVEPKAPWAQRMIQMQLALVYWQTFCCKIVGSQWLDGTAVYYATRLDDMQRFPAPWLTDNLFLLKGLNWYTLIIELFGWTLIWFKETRYWVVVGLLVLHMGIDYIINLPVFEWAFIAALITFVDPQDWRRLRHLLQWAERLATPAKSAPKPGYETSTQ